MHSLTEVSSETGHLVEVNRTTHVSKVTHVPKGFAGSVSQSPIHSHVFTGSSPDKAKDNNRR